MKIFRTLWLTASLGLGGLCAAQAEEPDAYVKCSFFPQSPACEQVYQQALHEGTPAASAVREAYENYGRYLKDQTGSLTVSDEDYLRKNEIHLPMDLSQADLNGLHNVINDPDLDDIVRRPAVNNFLSHAAEAALYCGLGSPCEQETPASRPGG